MQINIRNVFFLCIFCSVFNSGLNASEPVPVFRGDYPDPSIVRVGDDYYMTHNSSHSVPGLFVYHSTDMINWKLLGPAITEYMGDVFAPEIVHCKGKFYIYFPALGSNYVVWAEKPEGPWSKPINLEVGHIDPGHLITPDGKRYLYLSGIHVVPLSEDGLSTTEKPKHIFTGWPVPDEWQIECHCLESPKVFFKDGYYHMITAQGGTAGPPTGHMITHARSKNPFGPWENSPHNPITRAKSRKETWGMRGHGTVFDDKNGDWWVLYHAYEKDYFNLGRQNLLEPLEWTKDNWLRVSEDPERMKSLPERKKTPPFEDRFDGNSPAMQWVFWQRTLEPGMEFTGDAMIWNANGSRIEETNPLLIRAQDHSYEVMVDVEIEDGCEAGLVLFYNPMNYVGIKLADDGYHTGLRNVIPNNIIPRTDLRRAILKIRNDENSVEFFTSEDGGKTFQKIGTGLDVSGFHTNTFGGYSSMKPGLFCIGKGKASFRNFRYVPIPENE